jgi:hypothetical protein
MFGVLFRCVFVVFGRVQRMPMRYLGMMRSLFVIANLMVLCRFAMVLGSMLMMLRGLLVMLMDFVALAVHRRLPGLCLRWQTQTSPGSMNHLRSKFVR